MAGVDTTTPKKKTQIATRERVTETRLNEFNSQAQEMDALDNLRLLSSASRMVEGMEISLNSGKNFDIDVGAGLWKGELVQLTSTGSVILTDNLDPNPRIDLIEITGVSEAGSDSVNKVLLSALARTAVAAFAVGTGDASTKPWDLGHAGVIIDTVQVFLAGVQVDGWAFSKGTGTGAKDQIIFNDAPGSGVAITANYTYLTGGVEASTPVNTKFTLTPTFNVVVGTPAASPSVPSGTAGSVRVGTIEVPGSWTGGGSPTILYDVRNYMVHPDKLGDGQSSYAANSGQSGRVTNPIRNMHQTLEGFRMVWVSTTEIKVTPGFGVVLGNSFYSKTDILSGTLALGGAAWHYVYLSTSAGAGLAPTISTSTTAPTSKRMITSSTANDFYVGAIYWDGAAVRKFYTRGDWVFWDSEISKALTVPVGSATDLDVTDACPITGRTLFCRLQVSLGSSASDGSILATVQSQRAANIGDPTLRASVLQPSTSLTVIDENNGVVIAEEDTAVRYVNYDTDTNGTVASEAATLYIQGYLDDYRTLDTSGAAMFY